jgi:hypothetical protein
MCRLGAAVVLRSACTPAAVTLSHQRRSRDVSAGRLLSARTPASVTWRQQLRLSSVSAVQLLIARTPSPVTWLRKLRFSAVSAVQLLTARTPTSSAGGEVERRKRGGCLLLAECPPSLYTGRAAAADTGRARGA